MDRRGGDRVKTLLSRKEQGFGRASRQFGYVFLPIVFALFSKTGRLTELNLHFGKVFE